MRMNKLVIFVIILLINIMLVELHAKEPETEVSHYHSVKSIEDRLDKIDSMINKENKIFDKISLSGVVEAELGYEKINFKDATLKDSSSTDIVLATVELGIDASISDLLNAHVLLLYEEDDTDPINIDEGYIIIKPSKDSLLYIHAGKMFVPFGNFESHLISDPLTLELGETSESAILIGINNDIFNFSLTVFNGDINKISSDEKINSFTLNSSFSSSDLINGVKIDLGISYISNIADTDNMQIVEESLLSNELADYISGGSIILSLEINENLHIISEYLGALKKFEIGELLFDETKELKPSAWNFEIAYNFNDQFEIGASIQGTKDCDNFLPEKMYAGVISLNLLENLAFALEYQNRKFDNQDKVNLITSQIALEF